MFFRRKNLITPLQQRISRSDELAGKQSLLNYRSGRKHELLRKNLHSWILVIRLVLPLLQWDTGTVTPRKTERQPQSVITQRAVILMAWMWRKTIFRFKHIANDFRVVHVLFSI